MTEPKLCLLDVMDMNELQFSIEKLPSTFHIQFHPNSDKCNETKWNQMKVVSFCVDNFKLMVFLVSTNQQSHFTLFALV